MVQTISVRKLHSDLPNIARQVKMGVKFIVFKNSVPLFEINKVNTSPDEGYSKTRLIEGLQALQFKSNETDLSQRVDEIVYGI